jgi:hypothetical protein
MSRRSYKNPHAVSILNNPDLMGKVRRKKLKEPPADTLIAKVEKLREIYRILRDKPFIEQLQPPEIQPTDQLMALFPWIDVKVIEFAIHVEEFTSLLPMELFQLWVEIPEKQLRKLIANCLLDDPNIYRLYAIIGMYLWATLNGYKSSMKDDFIFKQNQTAFMYSSMGISKSVARRILQEVNLSPSQAVSHNSGRVATLSQFDISPKSLIPQYLSQSKTIRAIKFNKGNKPKMDIPDPVDLLARFQGYVLLYPSDHYGSVHPIVPFIYYDKTKLRIPLTSGIVPALVGALFTPEELGGLLKSMPADQRMQKVRTLLGKASKSIRETDDWLKRFNSTAYHLPARHIDKRHDVLRVFNTMTHNGVQIDENTLEMIDIDALDPKRHNIENLHKERKKIKKFIASSPGGRLYGKYRFHVYSERVYTRHYNIQSLPNVFKPAIITDPERYFIYFDVVANDISMLFHLSGDSDGLQLISGGRDPYQVIIDQALPSAPLRDKAKAFVNPWIYGASLKTIVKNSLGTKGEMTLEEAETIQTQLSIMFCDASTWLSDVRWEVATHARIPSVLNLMDNADVPMPAALAPTRSAVFLVQRFGASLFRSILHLLAERGYEPAVFVHDSVLVHVPISRDREEASRDIEALICHALSRKGIEAINVKMGSGTSWGVAEEAATKRTLFASNPW